MPPERFEPVRTGRNNRQQPRESQSDAPLRPRIKLERPKVCHLHISNTLRSLILPRYRVLFDDRRRLAFGGRVFMVNLGLFEP
jgi:hypothetical protein